MRKVRFLDGAGSVRIGEWTESGIERTSQTYSPDDVDILAPVTPDKVIGVGKNYRSRFSSSDDYPEQPRIWWKGGPNVVSRPGAKIPIPAHGNIAYGAEIGVVIGKECKDVPTATAEEYIAGYTCVNDLSNHAYPNDPLMLREKSFDNSAPMGPVVASTDQTPDNPRVQLWVNGEKQQDSSGAELIYSISTVVSTVSEFITLKEDDVIMMGSPPDNGYVQGGDQIEIEIEGIGRFEHSVIVE